MKATQPHDPEINIAIILKYILPFLFSVHTYTTEIKYFILGETYFHLIKYYELLSI